MSKTSGSGPETGRWKSLWRLPSKKYLLGIPTGGVLLFVAGIIFWGGFNSAMDFSNTETFCLSCHVMKDSVYDEYKQSHHYSNRTGIRAICSDCHVPKIWWFKVRRKIQASTHEIPHWLMGTINTREKFEARRAFLAERVWESMRKTDSRECRNCHEIDHMDEKKQDRYSVRRHKKGIEKGETCIDCHKGVAHELPEGYDANGEVESVGEAQNGS